MTYNLMLVFSSGILALAFSFWKRKWISSQSEGNEKMKAIGSSIAAGAMAFLKAEYRVLSIFVFFVAIILGFANYNSDDSSILISLSFLTGAFTSGLAGFLGMRVATKANNRTTNAAQVSLARALSVAFSGGTVMGLSVVGLGVLGLSGLLLFYNNIFNNNINIILNVLSGFSLDFATRKEALDNAVKAIEPDTLDKASPLLALFK